VDDFDRWGKNKPQVERTDHADYSKNNLYVRRFMINCEGKLIENMFINLKDSIHLKESIVTIIYIPSKYIKVHNFGGSVSLHQNHFSFVTELRQRFNQVWNEGKFFNKKFPNQKDIQFVGTSKQGPLFRKLQNLNFLL
jgi:hypothetical protein